MTAEQSPAFPQASFPRVPPVVEELLRLSNFTTGRGTILEVLRRDERVGNRMAALANLVCPRSFPGPITTVDQVVLALDVRTVKGLALCLPLAEVARSTFPLLSPVRFLKHGLLTGLAARNMAMSLNIAHPDEVFMGGLLHDVGLALLIRAGPGAFAGLAQPWTEGTPQELALEKEKLKATHPEVGQDLSIHWRLPVVTGACIRHHHSQPEELSRDLPADVKAAIAVVQYADACARHHGHAIGKFDVLDASHPPRRNGITLGLTGAEKMLDDLAKKLALVEPVFFQAEAPGSGGRAPAKKATSEEIRERSWKLQSLKESLPPVAHISDKKAIEFNDLLLDLEQFGQEVKEWLITPDMLAATSVLFQANRKSSHRTVLKGMYIPREVLVARIDAVLEKLRELFLWLECQGTPAT